MVAIIHNCLDFLCIFSSSLINQGAKGEKGASGSKVGPPKTRTVSTYHGIIVARDDMSDFCDVKGERGIDGNTVLGAPGPPGPPGPVINLQDVCDMHTHDEWDLQSMNQKRLSVLKES